MGRVLLAALGILFAPALDATAGTVVSFEDAVQMYGARQFDAAVTAVQSLTQKQLEKGVSALFEATPLSLDTLRAAAGVLSEAAVGWRILRDVRWLAALVAANGCIDRIDRLRPHSPFVLHWRLFLTSALQGQHEVLVAMDYARGTWSYMRLRNMGQGPSVVAGTRAMEVLPTGVVGDDDADLRLAIACIHEIAWVRTQGKVGIHLTQGSLDAAASELRHSMELRPSVETQLHLGRVLTLAGKYDDAARVLGGIDPAIEPAFQYLREMFTGDVAERRGDAAGAAAHYANAVKVLPMAQSARVALAEVRHLAGERAAAAAEMLDATASSRDTPDTADPWTWYVRGMAWRVEEYRTRLRAAAVHAETAR